MLNSHGFMQKESAASVAKFMTSSLSMSQATKPGTSICLGLVGFTREIWICPVTLTVLGHYLQYIYIKQMTLA